MYAISSIPRMSMRLALGALAVVFAGCAPDSALDPAFQPTAGPANHPVASLVDAQNAPDSTDVTFTVPTTGGIYQLGKHVIYFGANSICDPATSTYGPTEWNAPCDPVTTPVTITANVRWTKGRAWVHFSPELRFVPSSNMTRYVWLYMASRDASEGTTADLTLYWSKKIGEKGIDEGIEDSRFATFLWAKYRVAFRQITHFSGYNVHDGYYCPVELDWDGTCPVEPERGEGPQELN